MKLFKKGLIGLFSILIVASFTLWILAKNTDSETIRALVNEQLTCITNKKSEIKGNIAWQIFPTPGIKVLEINIGEKEDDYRLSVNSLLLNLKIMPLISGKLVFNSISLDGVDIYLNADAPRKPTSIPLAQATYVEKNNAIQLVIDRFLLSHGQLHLLYQGKNLHLKNIRLGVEQFNLHNVSFPVQLKGILSSDNSAVKAQINYNGHLSLSENLLKKPFSEIKPTIEGQILLKNIQFNRLSIDKINANISTTEKKISLTPLTLSLYNGESIGDMHYNYANKILSFNQTASNLDGKSFMTALTGNESVHGSLDYSIQAELPINDFKMDKLSGKGNISLKDGTLKRVNLALLIDDVKNIIGTRLGSELAHLKEALEPEQFNLANYNQNSTPFKLISIQYLLNNAELKSESLILQTDNLQINGGGSLNLLNQNIESHLKVTVATNHHEEGLNTVQQLLGGSFPILLQGTLTAPSLQPDLSSMNDILQKLSLKKSLKKPLRLLIKKSEKVVT